MIATPLTTIATTLYTNESSIDSMGILCNNKHTVDILFKNKDIITNVPEARNSVKQKDIGGNLTSLVDQEGDLLGNRKVYYHLQVTAKCAIVLQYNKRFMSVAHDNKVQDAFMVTRDDGTTMKYRPSKEGLYYYYFIERIQ